MSFNIQTLNVLGLEQKFTKYVFTEIERRLNKFHSHSVSEENRDDLTALVCRIASP